MSNLYNIKDKVIKINKRSSGRLAVVFNEELIIMIHMIEGKAK